MTQDQALDILKTGGNVFLTGEPGAGKTYVINEYIAWLEACKLSVAVTATTGIAATHIGGMTIHAWSGIGAKDHLSRFDLDQITTREKIMKRVKNAHVLVIDEISMLDGSLLDMVNQVCQTVRQREEPFGGIQVVLVGDFFQLPPVTRRGDVMRYAFESRAWQTSQFLVCYLTDQYRQADELFLSLLKSIRKNEIEEEHYTLLSEQTEIAFPDIEPTRLYTHNKDVDVENNRKLAEIPGTVRKFTMSHRGSKLLVEGLVKNCLSPGTLELKEDAMVMCTKNNFEAGYVNGTLGRVVAFDFETGYPVIETKEGKQITIKPTTWEYAEENKVMAEIEQFPLRLAWAITVHKSQGMSLDAAEIDLSNAFVYGQGYVALSRVRSLDGLKMLGMNPNALGVDPKVVAIDQRFHADSDDAESAFIQLEEEELEHMHQQFVLHHGGTYVREVITAERNAPADRIKKENTFSETKTQLLAGAQVIAIAKTRNLSPTTIWTHIEKLIDDQELSLKEISHILSSAEYIAAKSTLLKAVVACGPEKLKPIYEHAGEQYDYDLVRLARIEYLLSTGEKS